MCVRACVHAWASGHGDGSGAEVQGCVHACVRVVCICGRGREMEMERARAGEREREGGKGKEGESDASHIVRTDPENELFSEFRNLRNSYKTTQTVRFWIPSSRTPPCGAGSAPQYTPAIPLPQCTPGDDQNNSPPCGQTEIVGSRSCRDASRAGIRPHTLTYPPKRLLLDFSQHPIA